MAKTRRIVHVVRRFDPFVGGTERAVLDLASAQAREGHRVTVVTADRDVSGVEGHVRLPRSGRSGDIRVLRLPVIGNRRSTVTTRPDQLVRSVLAADIVHLHDLRFMTATIALTCAAARHPLIIHTHGLFFHTSFATRLKRLMLRFYYAPMMDLLGAWVAAVSESDEERLLALAPRLARRTLLLPNGIDLRPFFALERRPLPGLIIATGRVVSSKGLDDLIDVVARLRYPGVRLVIAGAGDPDELWRLKQRVRDVSLDGRVDFTGRFDPRQLAELLSTAALAAFPSRAEGFGLALLEAIAAGVPVLARDIPAHRALLGAGHASGLTDFSDQEAAARDLDGLLGLSDAQLAVRSHEERIRAANFGVGRLVSQLEDLYTRFDAARANGRRQAN